MEQSWCITLTYIVLLQVTQHDHCWYFVVHHHLPEISDSVLHWTLSYDEGLLLTIALRNKNVEEFKCVIFVLTFTKLA